MSTVPTDPTIFITQMVGLSVAAERVTETAKLWLSPLVGKLSGPAQSACYQVLAMISAMLAVLLSHADPLNVAKDCNGSWLSCQQGWACLVFTGILASGGSAFWNHLLDIVKAAKVKAEQTENVQLAAAHQPTIVG